MRSDTTKKSIAAAAGAALAAAVCLAPLPGLSGDGKVCLALSLAAVVWWATGALHPGYVSAALLTGYALAFDSGRVPGTVIFGIWTTPAMYLVIGGFLIAQAVQESGLGKRLSLHFVKQFVRSYVGVIVSCYVLGFLLSFIIPHPWPRSFLLMSVMNHVTREAHLSRSHAGHVGLAVFAGSVPTSAILLTGDSTLNPLVGQLAGVELSYLDWLWRMGVPGVFASIATCLVQLALAGKPREFFLEPSAIRQELARLGPVTKKEKRVALVVAAAIALWCCDSATGLNPGWVAMAAVVALAMPFVGGLEAGSWRHVNVGTLLFLCAALAIGTVGNATGMNAWLAETLLPDGGEAGLAMFALVAVGVCVLLHMCLGSTLAVLGIAGPAVIAFGAAAGVPPLVSAMLAYCAVSLHWLLPFHHMNLLVGAGDDGGGYDTGQVFRFGLAQTLVMAATCALALAWWKIAGFF